MHLYIGVRLRRVAPEQWEVTAPDLPECRTTGRSSGEALARARLALEGLIAARLGREEPLPQPRSRDQLLAEDPTGVEYFEVHINLRHLRALARHQAGRWQAGA